jgi:hypothetical protein
MRFRNAERAVLLILFSVLAHASFVSETYTVYNNACFLFASTASSSPGGA